jgi:hypothetical protein
MFLKTAGFNKETVGCLPDPNTRNSFLLHIVTRWKRDSNGIKIDRGGKFVMQFVAFKRVKDDDMWCIPAILEEHDRSKHPRSITESPGYEQVRRTRFDSAVNQYAFTKKNFNINVTEPQKIFVQEQVDQLFYVPEGPKGQRVKTMTYPHLGRQIYEGFMDDERNTENGWTKVRVVIHHDDKDVLEAYSLNKSKPMPLPKAEQRSGRWTYDGSEPPNVVAANDWLTTTVPNKSDAPAEVAWLTLHRDLDLCGEEEDLLQHVASIHDAYW